MAQPLYSYIYACKLREAAHIVHDVRQAYFHLPAQDGVAASSAQHMPHMPMAPATASLVQWYADAMKYLTRPSILTLLLNHTCVHTIWPRDVQAEHLKEGDIHLSHCRDSYPVMHAFCYGEIILISLPQLIRRNLAQLHTQACHILQLEGHLLGC